MRIIFGELPLRPHANIIIYSGRGSMPSPPAAVLEAGLSRKPKLA